MIELSAPVHVAWEITPKCTQSCFFCEPKLAGRSEDFLTTQEALSVLKKLVDNEIYSVFLTGGEPLLRKDITVLISECIDYGIHPGISTNAHLATSEKARELYKAGLRFLQVSIQGPKSVHDRMVKMEGSYELAIRGLRNLKSEGFYISIASVVTKLNYRSLPALVEELGRQKLVDNYRTLRLMTFSRSMLHYVVPPSEIKEVNKLILRKAREYEVSISELYSGLEKRGKRKLHPLQATCKAGKIKFDILPDGSVSPCKSIKKDFIVGNILHENIEYLWNHPHMRLFRRLTPDDYEEECGKCGHKWNCYSCRAIAYNLTGNLYGDDLSCWYFLEKT